MIRGPHHAGLTTQDVDGLLHFYCDLLGFEKVFEMEWGVGTESCDAVTGVKDSARQDPPGLPDPLPLTADVES